MGTSGPQPERVADGAVRVRTRGNARRAKSPNFLSAEEASFDSIPHDQLMASVAARIVDRAMLSLLKSWLRAPVRDGQTTGGQKESGGKSSRQGTPQGGVISPLLANRYMNRMLRHWEQTQAAQRYKAQIVAYADDFVILSKGRAAQAQQWVQATLQRLGLQLNPDKTRICNARTERFDFLGYSLGLHRLKRGGSSYLGASASDKSVQRLKDRVREQLRTQIGPWEDIRERLNRTLQGWENYFRHGSKHRSYRAINNHVSTKVRNFLQRRHHVPSRGTRRFSNEAIFGPLGVHQLKGAR
jgi:RNA-directed DNA polymerase